MKLNRKARRAQKKGNWQRPTPDLTPQQQMKAFLDAPGKFHIVRLPDGKSFVVKVTDAEMPIFATICQQLRGVLGFCEAIAATPVDAAVANTQQVAESSAESTKRIREARARIASIEESDLAPDRDFFDPASAFRSATAEKLAAGTLDAAVQRRPAGKQRGGRHRAPEPDTVFDQLAAGADDAEGRARLASIEIAAAQDAANAASDELEKANQRLRDAYERGGDIHNARVLDQMTEHAAEAVEEAPPYFDADDYDIDRTDIRRAVDNQIVSTRYSVDCARAGCDWTHRATNAADLGMAYADHLTDHDTGKI